MSKEKLSEQEVWDVLEFARNISPQYGNYFSPDMINSTLKDINVNPTVADQSKIEEALKNPKDSEDNLIGYSQYFELTDMVYKRAKDYIANLLAYDLTYYPVNATKTNMKTTQYKKDVERLNEFLDKFNHKQEFSRATRQMLSQEGFFSVLRDEGSKYTLQELPRKYCKITGRWEYGFLFDFDMYWFSQPSVDLRMYPDVFKEMYNGWMEQKEYNPSRPVGKRDTGFTYWMQTDPEDNFWAWKFNPDTTLMIPYLTPMLSDVALRPLIRNLQKNVYILQAQRLVIGLIPMMKENKAGNVKDMLAVSPEMMGKFMGLMKQGLDDAIKIGAAPFEDIKSIDFDSTDKDILNTYTKNLASTSVSGGRLVYSGDKQTSLETQLSVAVDEMIAKYLYSYFEDFLEYHINRRTKTYKFKFKLEGTNMPEDRKKRFERAMTLADKGIVLPQKIASASGMSLKEMETQLDMAGESNFTDKLISMINIYTQTEDKAKSGGQEKEADELTDNGLASKDNR